MKKTLFMNRLDALWQPVRKWINRWRRKDDDDLFGHPFAIL